MQPDNFYHIFNHANGNENLFRNHNNYVYFLRRFVYFTAPVADTYAYCLMPNHFHFLVKIKSEDQLLAIPGKGTKHCKGFYPSKAYPTIDKYVIGKFAHLFNGYTQAFNKMHDRKGCLFRHPFKRKRITDDYYLTEIIRYIHSNPVHHGFTKEMDDWPYSSFFYFLNTRKTFLKRHEVLEIYQGMEEFLNLHKQSIQLKIDEE